MQTGADLKVSPLCLFPLPQGFIDDHGAFEGAGGVHVAVDVRRGGDVAVSKPLLDQLHLHALRDKERCAGVAQVVEADVLESVLLQDRGKAVAHVIGCEQLAQRVQAHVVRILAAIRVAKHLGDDMHAAIRKRARLAAVDQLVNRVFAKGCPADDLARCQHVGRAAQELRVLLV